MIAELVLLSLDNKCPVDPIVFFHFLFMALPGTMVHPSGLPMEAVTWIDDALRLRCQEVENRVEAKLAEMGSQFERYQLKEDDDGVQRGNGKGEQSA